LRTGIKGLFSTSEGLSLKEFILKKLKRMLQFQKYGGEPGYSLVFVDGQINWACMH
jgi:hypothetical protein